MNIKEKGTTSPKKEQHKAVKLAFFPRERRLSGCSMRLAAFCVAAFCCLLPAKAQPDSIPLLTVEAQQADWDSLQAWLTGTLVDPFEVVPPETWQTLVESVNSQLTTPRSQVEFLRVVLPAVQVFQDIHTRLWLPRAANPYFQQGGHYLPLAVRSTGEGLVIVADKDSLLPKGAILEQINGHSADSLFGIILSTQFTEAFLPDPRLRLSEEEFMGRLGWFLPLDTIAVLHLRLPDGLPDTILYPTLQGNTYKPPKPTREEKKARPWAFSQPDTLPAAVLTIKSFRGGGSFAYQRFLRKSFRQLNEDGVPWLIIDVRGNKGGYLYRGELLSRYLAEEPFTYTWGSIVKSSPLSRAGLRERFFLPGITLPLFSKAFGQEIHFAWNAPFGQTDTIRNPQTPPMPKKMRYEGKVLLLTDGLSISNSVLLRNCFYLHGFGESMGTVVAGTASGTYGNAVSFTLPNSRLEGTVSTIRLLSNPEGWAQGQQALLPEYPVEWSREAFLEGKDAVMEAAIRHILRQTPEGPGNK